MTTPSRRHGGAYIPRNRAMDTSMPRTTDTSMGLRTNDSGPAQSPHESLNRPSELEPVSVSDQDSDDEIYVVHERPKKEANAMPHDIEKGNIAEKAFFIPKNGDINKKPRVHLRGYLNIWRIDSRMTFKLFGSPHFYQKAAHTYDKETKHRHKDTMHRVTHSKKKDKFPSPVDGKAKNLIVQSVDEIYKIKTSEGTWDRTFVRNMAPLHLRLALWGTSHIHYTKTPTIWDHIVSWLKYIPTCLLLVFVISFPGNANGEIRNNGRYDSFPYRFWGYAKAARNPIEQAKAAKATKKAKAVDGHVGNLSERILLPRILCVPNPRKDGAPCLQLTANEYKEYFAHKGSPRYVFISYSSKHFSSNEDLDELHEIAIQATLDARLDAYWVGCSCMAKKGPELEQDVSLATATHRNGLKFSKKIGLPHQRRKVGDRLWIFPEMLLSPSKTPIRVYRPNEPSLSYGKHAIAAFAWKDSQVSRKLIDHYDNTLGLSRLELISVALKCLAPRTTDKYLDGDVTYALMGLMSLRPVVDRTDSEFQAFARLSLANDSDCLLERFMCILPKNSDQPWHCMDDAYGVNLWDIYPSVQLAGVGKDDTVILDNARAASVRWKSFVPVHSVRRFSWTRQILKIALHSSVFIMAVGALCIWGSLHLKEYERSFTFFESSMRLRKREDGLLSEVVSSVKSAAVSTMNLLSEDQTDENVSMWYTLSNITSAIEDLTSEFTRTNATVAGLVTSTNSSIWSLMDISLNWTAATTHEIIDGFNKQFNTGFAILAADIKNLTERLDSLPSFPANIPDPQENTKSLMSFNQPLKPIIEGIINTDALLVWGIVLVVWAILLLAAAPKLLRVLYGGKFWNTQPWIFGFEGYMDIETIEAQIFGTCKGRLRWSAFGSPLSRHKLDEFGHCEPVDPTTSSRVQKLVKKAKTSKTGEQKVFTIVDTNTMTVTLFQAARAPVAFLLLGSEGGMQRAVGCSYDWTTETLHRETVLRMETSVLDKMDIIPRVMLSIQPQDQAVRNDGIKPDHKAQTD